MLPHKDNTMSKLNLLSIIALVVVLIAGYLDYIWDSKIIIALGCLIAGVLTGIQIGVEATEASKKRDTNKHENRI